MKTIKQEIAECQNRFQLFKVMKYWINDLTEMFHLDSYDQSIFTAKEASGVFILASEKWDQLRRANDET